MNSNIQKSYLDILFANRNKAYGAYDLRKNYEKRMMLAGLIMSLAVVLLIGWLRLSNENKTDISFDNGLTEKPPVHIKEIELPINKQIKEKIVPQEHAGRTAKTQDYSQPKVVADNAMTKPAMKRLADDAMAGPVDNNGLDGGNAIALDNSLHDGTGDPNARLSKKGDPTSKVVVGEDGDQTPMSFVSEKPSFPGGEAALKKFLRDNLIYPNRARTDEISGTVHVSFVVNTDGSIVDVKINRGLGGGCSEEAMRVVKAMPKWKAGRHNGHAVRAKMSIPIIFTLQ